MEASGPLRVICARETGLELEGAGVWFSIPIKASGDVPLNATDAAAVLDGHVRTATDVLRLTPPRRQPVG